MKFYTLLTYSHCMFKWHCRMHDGHAQVRWLRPNRLDLKWNISESGHLMVSFLFSLTVEGITTFLYIKYPWEKPDKSIFFTAWQDTHFRFHNHLQTESPDPRQSHSLVNSVKPGALVSPLPVPAENTNIRKPIVGIIFFCLIKFTLYDITEVTVVGAVIKQAGPKCWHRCSLNSKQRKQDYCNLWL